MSIHNLSNYIFDIKDNLKDNDYKNILEGLQQIHKENQKLKEQLKENKIKDTVKSCFIEFMTERYDELVDLKDDYIYNNNQESKNKLIGYNKKYINPCS